MVSLGGASYGPLSEDLLRRQVDVDVIDGVVEIYYDRELRARFDKATGDRLPLDDDDSLDQGVLEPTSESLMS